MHDMPATASAGAAFAAKPQHVKVWHRILSSSHVPISLIKETDYPWRAANSNTRLLPWLPQSLQQATARPPCSSRLPWRHHATATRPRPLQRRALTPLPRVLQRPPQ